MSPQASDAFNFDYGRSLIFEPHNIFHEILILLDWVWYFPCTVRDVGTAGFIRRYEAAKVETRADPLS